MKVTFLGTTSLLFDDGHDQVLFDAHFTRPSIIKMVVGKISSSERIVDELIQKYEMQRLRAIFVSHSHHDHVMDAPMVANKCDCEVYGSPSTLNVARGMKVKEERLHSFDEKQTVQIGDFTITVIPSLHSKAKWYNNDLGQTIDTPLQQPAKKKDYKEGGSYDFLGEHNKKKYLIRPSCNYIEGQCDEIQADVLFLGVGGLSKLSKKETKKFFIETIDKVKPNMVIPLHWDNFFSSLRKPAKGMPVLFEDTKESLFRVALYCEEHQISYVLLLPRTFIVIE